MNTELIDYVRGLRDRYGRTEPQARDILIKAGWSRRLVNDVLAHVYRGTPLKRRDVVRMTERPKGIPGVLALVIFLFLAALAIMTGFSWGFGSAVQIFTSYIASIFLPVWILMLGGAERIEGTVAAEWILSRMQNTRRRDKTLRTSLNNAYLGTGAGEPSYSHLPAGQIKKMMVVILVMETAALFTASGFSGSGPWTAFREETTAPHNVSVMKPGFITEGSCERWVREEAVEETGVGLFFCGKGCALTSSTSDGSISANCEQKGTYIIPGLDY